jgi:hypothetical protein
MSSAEILRLRRKAQDGVDLPVREKLDRCGRSAGDPADVVDRVEPDMSRHDGHVLVLAPSQGWHADALALQVADAADRVVSEQFKTADMHPSQQRDRVAGIDCGHPPKHSVHQEIGFAARNRLPREAWRRIHIADIREALRAQQLLGDILRGNADASGLRNANGGCFEGTPRPALAGRGQGRQHRPMRG